MGRFREKLKTGKGKIHLVVWSVYWVLTAILFFSHTDVVFGEKTGRPAWVVFLYIAVIAALLCSIGFCFYRWVFAHPRQDADGKEIRGKFSWYHLLIFAGISGFCFLVMELMNNAEKLPEMKPLYMAMNILGCFIMMLILMAWLNSFRRTVMTMLIFASAMSIVFYCVYLFRGEPFQFIDLFSFSTAMEVVGGYRFVWTRWVTVMLTFALCAIGITLHCPDYSWAARKRTKILSRVGAAGFMIVMFELYLNTGWNSALGIVTDLWAPHDTYEEVGTNMGFFCVAKFMRNKAPEGYSVQAAEEVAEESVAEYQKQETQIAEKLQTDTVIKPVNIIAIMNEAWADYSVFEKFQTNESYQPYYYSMEDNVIKGHTLVCISGGGTAKTEYEFLTGNSVKQYPGMVPYVSYYTHDQYSLVSTLEAQGYETAAMHPNKGTNWNRVTAYRLLGFDNFYTIDDFDENAERYRNMITDKENYQKIIDVIESKDDPSQPFFLFDVTMQNHGGYTTDNFPISITVDGYQDDAWNRYLSLVKKSDEALQYLIEYFKDCDEPTMIVMFGDHFPSLDEGVEKFLSGDTRDNLPVDEMEQYYQTPFFIWTNYDMESELDVTTSTNFLGTLMMEKAGLKRTDFENYQILLQEDIKAYNHKAYLDADGTFVKWSDAPDAINKERLEYEYLQYNALVEDRNRLDWFFTIREGDG